MNQHSEADIAVSEYVNTIDPLEERRRKRKRSTILFFIFYFFERARKGHRQSDRHWNCFQGYTGQSSERRSGAHVGFHERLDTVLN